MEAKPKRASRAKKVVEIAKESVVAAFGATTAPAQVAPPAKKSAAKKKAADISEAEGEGPAIFIEELETPVLPIMKSKKTASKKPGVIASVTPDGIKGNLTPVAEQRPLIAHLPIHISDIDNDLFAPTPSQPDPIDLPKPFDLEETFATYGQDQDKVAIEPVEHVPSPVTPTRPSLPLHYSEKLMVRFQDANREQRLPESTDVACFWDCATFRGPPCVIPTMIEEGIWRVYGNFCCPECAAAYLFHERLDLHVQWERYALMNRLYATDAESVHLAPARSVLRLFGGPMDVSDFRAMLAEKRMRIDVMTPPMISIIQVMDTKPIDFYDASMKNTFIPWEMDRMNRPGAQGLRLRRNKPVAEKEATLEYCMGITA